jgi:adenylylsulfate kinase
MSDTNKEGFGLFLTGLPASGKTTLARFIQQSLAARDVPTQLLDSDELRKILTPEPTYTDMERDWFYRTLAYIAGLLTKNGVNVIIAATAPWRVHRLAARRRIKRFAEIYLVCPEEVCRRRDPKNLWKKADQGKITNLPGANATYEVPEEAEVIVDSVQLDPAQAAMIVINQLEAKLFL